MGTSGLPHLHQRWALPSSPMVLRPWYGHQDRNLDIRDIRTPSDGPPIQPLPSDLEKYPTIENKHAIKEWTSIHVFCRTAELPFIKHSTSSRKLNRISEHHKNTIFTILIIIYLFNKPADFEYYTGFRYIMIIWIYQFHYQPD